MRILIFFPILSDSGQYNSQYGLVLNEGAKILKKISNGDAHWAKPTKLIFQCWANSESVPSVLSQYWTGPVGVEPILDRFRRCWANIGPVPSVLCYYWTGPVGVVPLLDWSRRCWANIGPVPSVLCQYSTGVDEFHKYVLTRRVRISVNWSSVKNRLC